MRRALVALALCACGSQPERALLDVSVAAQIASAQITRVSVQVVPAGVSADLSRDAGGTFSGTLSVPTGAQTVNATAWAGLSVAGTASAAVTVVKGQTARVAITILDATGAPPQPDHSPVITSLSASASAAIVGDRISLSAAATDADGDAISFLWTAAPSGCGTFSAAGSASTAFTAAAAGNCVVTVAATARGLSDTRSTTIAISGGGGAPPSPALVQHLSSTSNPPAERRAGNDFRFTLPNPVMAGNCLVLGISYTWSAARTVHISDSAGNVWPTTPAATTTDAVNLISSIFVLPGAKGGTTTITVGFDASVIAFQYTVSEFDNLDPISPVSGSSRGQTTAPALAAPSFIPANNDAAGGNLIWSYFMDHEFAPQNGVTNFAPGTNFALLDADIGWTNTGLPHASQWFLQRTAAAVAPAMTATGATGDGFNGVAVALKVAAAGGPAPGGIRIEKIAHFTNPVPPNTWNFQFPTVGNLIVGVVCQSDIIGITSVTDSKGNVYTKVEPATDEPQFWFARNAVPDPNLKITVHSAGTPVNSSFLWYDISGADPLPLDGQAHLSGGGISAGRNSIVDAPLITPASLGLTLAAISFGTGPATGLTTGAPPLAIFDYVSYAGEIDLDRMDNADGRAHLYNTDLSAEHYNWILNHTIGTTASATAVHFKAAAP
ncbi:MAG TPA: hypothetical protein VI356_22445 [Myxococcales bacterium]